MSVASCGSAFCAVLFPVVACAGEGRREKQIPFGNDNKKSNSKNNSKSKSNGKNKSNGKSNSKSNGKSKD